MNFLFPQRIDEFTLINSLSHLEDLLQEENRLLLSNIKLRCALRKGKYIYAKCKFKRCSSYLTYHQNGELFSLVKFNNQHSHSSQGTRAALYKKIEEQISELPLSTSIATAKHLICQKYKIQAACFYYLFKKIKNRKITYLQLTNLLVEKKYQVQSDPYYYGMNELPDLMIVVSPLMKENYKLYGHWMGFDFTYNIIQELNDKGRQWKIGVFTGISSSKKIVPFGLVICNQETKGRYQQIFKTFSDIMNRLPDVIITDEDKGLISALETLKEKRQFEGTHLLDCFHILRNVKKNLVQKQCWTYFNRMIRERSVDSFQKLREECLMSMQNEKDIETLKRFLQNSYRYCFCYTPRSLFGFLPNSTMNEKLHDLIKGVLPYSKPFTVSVNKILLYLEELGMRCHEFQLEVTRYEELFHYPPLKEVRFAVCKTILKEIISELSIAFHHESFLVTEYKYIIKNIYNKEYLVVYQEGRWRCQCEYLSKTGIFCSHLVKVIMMLKLQLLDYIHPRWKLNIEGMAEVKKKYRHQRKTRRAKK